MNTRYALKGVGLLAGVALMVGCSADAGSSDDTEGELKVPQPSTEQYDFAPPGAEFQAAKVEVDDSLSPKGSATRKYGSTFMKAISIPPNGIVGCYTANGSAGVDPVLALIRRHDNQHKTTPYTEKVWVQTLAFNDDAAPGDLHPYLSFNNTSGGTLNAYLMGFAYGDSTGTADLWCTGSNVESMTLGAGSLKVTASSGAASTSGSNGDPWLFMIDETLLSYNSDWNDDTTSTNRESSFNYQGPSRTVWFVANGWHSGNTTINY
jgi:hypothetical protein